MPGYGKDDTLFEAPAGGGYGENDRLAPDETDIAAPGFIPTIKRTGGQMLTTLATTAEDVTGPNALTKGLRETGQGIIDRNPAGIQSLGDIVESPWLTAKEAVGQFVPQIGAAAAGGLAGAKLGQSIGGVPGAAIGGAIGGLAPIFTQEYGGIRQDQIEAGQEDKGRALLAAGAATALERVGMGKALKGLRGELPPVSTIPREIAKGVLKEGGTEAAQNVIEQLGAFKDPTTAPNVADTALAGVMGGIGGGIVGGAHAGIQKALERPAEQPDQPGTEQPLAEQPAAEPPAAVEPALVPRATDAAVDPLTGEIAPPPETPAPPPETPPALPGDPIRANQMPEVGPLSAGANMLIEAEAQAADAGQPVEAPVTGALLGLQRGDASTPDGEAQSRPEVPGTQAGSGGQSAAPPSDASMTPGGLAPPDASKPGGGEQEAPPPAPVFDPATGTIAQPQRATFDSVEEVTGYLSQQRRGGGASQGKAIPSQAEDGRWSFVRAGEPEFEQAQVASKQREADQRMRADTAFEKAKPELPQHLRELKPQDRKLYDFQKAIDAARKPADTAERIADEPRPSFDTAYTPEMAQAQAAKHADTVKTLDGKLRSGNVTGATTGQLIQAWTARQRERAAIDASKKVNPALWAAYDERQKVVATLKPGEQVLTPYPSPEHPQGTPGKLVRKFGVNWRVETPQGDQLLVPPTALRPVDKPTSAPVDKLAETPPSGQAPVTASELAPDRKLNEMLDQGGNKTPQEAPAAAEAPAQADAPIALPAPAQPAARGVFDDLVPGARANPVADAAPPQSATLNSASTTAPRVAPALAAQAQPAGMSLAQRRAAAQAAKTPQEAPTAAEVPMQAEAPSAPATPESASARGTLNVREVMKANSGPDGRLKGDAAAAAIVQQVQRSLNTGQRVTLYADGKPQAITAVDRGMMRDDKGQRWGALTLLTDPDGKLGNRIEFTASTQADAPIAAPVPALAAAPAALAPEEQSARWTRATAAERGGLLADAGLSANPQSLSTRRALAQPWEKLSDSQRTRLAAALDKRSASETEAANTPAAAPPTPAAAVTPALANDRSALAAAAPPPQDGYTDFKPETGSLGVPRSDMPQIKAGDRSSLVQYLRARGVDYTEDSVDAGALKPTQAEYSPAKVAQAREFTGTDRAILVSSDGYIVDGHHQAMAKAEDGEQARVIRLEAPIAELLPMVREFPSAAVAADATPANASPAEPGRTTQPLEPEPVRSATEAPALLPPTPANEVLPTPTSDAPADGALPTLAPREPPTTHPDDSAARWTRSTSADRLGLLAAAGWSANPPSLSTRRAMAQPWEKLTDSQRERISVAATPTEAAQNTAATATPVAPPVTPPATQPTTARDPAQAAPTTTTASWVIRDKATGEAVLETFDRRKVEALNTAKYEAVPVQQHLAQLNAQIQKSEVAPAPTEPERKVGDMVKLTKPGVNGRVNITGTVSKIMPDGRLEVRTQNDGYMTIAPSELGHKARTELAATPSTAPALAMTPAAPAEAPAAPATTQPLAATSAPAFAPAESWTSAPPAQRGELLRAAGYNNADQARALSGTDWTDLSEPVRVALSAPASKPEAKAEVGPAPAGPSAAMVADEQAAGGDPNVWAGRAALKAGQSRKAPPELSAKNAPLWLKGFDDAATERTETLLAHPHIAGVKVKVKAIVAETGKTASYDEDAHTAIKDTHERLTLARRLMDCLNA
jgi:hypothetical protein